MPRTSRKWAQPSASFDRAFARLCSLGESYLESINQRVPDRVELIKSTFQSYIAVSHALSGIDPGVSELFQRQLGTPQTDSPPDPSPASRRRKSEARLPFSGPSLLSALQKSSLGEHRRSARGDLSVLTNKEDPPGMLPRLSEVILKHFYNEDVTEADFAGCTPSSLRLIQTLVLIQRRRSLDVRWAH